MQEQEISIKEMLVIILRKWRGILAFGIAVALIAGLATIVIRIVEMNDPDQVERWQAEYDAAKGAYWAGINDYDRQISENERLANAAQAELDALEQQEESLREDIQDKRTSIEYYDTQIEVSQANIDNLESEKEKLAFYLKDQTERNENSLFLQLDPYNVHVSEAYLRVDTGYRITPSTSYQTPDRTNEVLRTYIMLVNSTEFYQKMIDDLKLETEVRYLSELVDVSMYNENSLRVRVLAATPERAKEAADYICDALLADASLVKSTVTSHTIRKYSSQNYTYIDLDVYERQQAMLEKAREYESSSRSIDAEILNTRSEILNMKAEIRALNTEITDTKLEIDALPDTANAYRAEISSYQDARYSLLSEQLKLKEKKEPAYGGYTPFSVFTGFVKFVILGGIGGVCVAAFALLMMGLFSSRLQSVEQCAGLVRADYLGLWPTEKSKWLWPRLNRWVERKKEKNGKFARLLSKIEEYAVKLDHWIACVEGVSADGVTEDGARELVVSNLEAAMTGFSGKLMLCGGASREVIDGVGNALHSAIPSVDIRCSGDMLFDADTVRGLPACDGIILVEGRGSSDTNAIIALCQRAKASEKPILGFVIA